VALVVALAVWGFRNVLGKQSGFPAGALDASLPVLDKVATGGYHEGMNPVRTVGVKELRNRLSEYLRDVRRGTRVLVTDRNAVVAEFRQPGPDSRADERHPRAAEWLDSGLLIAPSRPKLPLPRSPVTLPAGTARAIVDALRDETRP
jgi:antitoxin (DNA-binding transcriptional repressor) of toxin-antitoxin stability system